MSVLSANVYISQIMRWMLLFYYFKTQLTVEGLRHRRVEYFSQKT